jgi:hypothetical protein
MASTSGQRWTDTVTPSTPAPPGPAELRARVSDLAEAVRRLSGDERREAPDPATDPLATDLIAMAERAAEEIRENARREAALVGMRRAHDATELASALLSAIARERQTIAVLAADVERLGQCAEQMRKHVRLLEGELGRIDAFLRAATAPAA